MIPATMRTTVFTAPGKVEVRTIPMPQPEGRQVLVQVKACAICTWEQRFYRGSKPEDYPFRGGHEASGVVVAKGPHALCDAQVGDPVCLEIMVRCGQCHYCRRGMDNLCLNDRGGALPGQPWGPGGMSDYVLVDDYMVYRASGGQDFAELALAEPVSCVARGIRRTPLSFGDTAVVQGAGVMGLLHLQLLTRRVACASSSPSRMRSAARLPLRWAQPARSIRSATTWSSASTATPMAAAPRRSSSRPAASLPSAPPSRRWPRAAG